MIIWITGLSASGKSTIGRAIYDLWKPQAPNTVLLDGEDIRRILPRSTGDDAYTEVGRHAAAQHYCEICAWLDGQDINVVCCTISFFEDLRESNRNNLSRYFEVFLTAPMKVLRNRDYKNLYAPAFAGKIKNVVGVDLPLIPPTTPDMIVDNTRDRADLGPVAEEILAKALNAKPSAAQ